MNTRHLIWEIGLIGKTLSGLPGGRLLVTIQHSIPLVVALLFLAAIPARATESKLSQYTYEDTKRLVSFVDQAAELIEHEGEHAFVQFGKRGSKWLRENYLFVYTPDGTNVFHPVEPGFVGKNLINLQDADGKPVVRLVTDIATLPTKDASGWVFYLWEDQTQLIPLWKSSYIRKAVAPDGKTYLVGSGLYNMKIERAWVADRVKQACVLLQAKGKGEAFKAFMEASSPFVFLDTYIFVLDENGHTLVDPAFPTMTGRDLSQFRDAVGMPAIRELLHKLVDHEEAWVQYLWPKPGNHLPSRKLIYARKVILDRQTLIVGSDFFLASPIWMKE